MEKAKGHLVVSEKESDVVSRLPIHPHLAGVESSFYEVFALKGIRVNRFEPGFVVCTFKVPRRLTERSGCSSPVAIASLVDVVGGSLVYVDGLPLKVSVDMSISYVSTAKINDEVEIIGRALGQKGGYSGTNILLKKKATGEIVAEGRHSLFRKPACKI